MVLFQHVELNVDDMVRPAPMLKKPHDNWRNPYPIGCSRLCNHPISNELRKEYRDLMKKSKESYVSVKHDNTESA